MRIVSSILIFLLVGCSSSWHMNKAIKKGAKVSHKIEYKHITKRDTLIVSNDTIIYERITDSIPYKTHSIQYIPLTRQERKRLKDSARYATKAYRWQIKAYKDSLKTLRTITRHEGRTQRRELKNNRGHNLFWFWVMFVITIGLVVYLFKRQ